MGTGYVRQSAADIITGAVVEAAPLNLEFNQLRDAFHETSGHSHDGTTGEGPKIALTTSISGVLPVVNGGFAAIHKINGTTAPTANEDSDDGYGVGSIWLDTTNDKAYICVDSTVAAAVWLTVGTATGFQPLDTDLTAIAALTSAADKVPYSTGAGTWALADFSSFGRSIVDDADAAALLTTLGVTSSVAELNYTDGVTSAIQTQLDAKQTLDADLTALAALSGTNTIYYRSAANTWSAVTIGGNLTFTGGTLDAVASSLDATLTAMAGVTTAADKAIYFTGVDTAAAYDLSSFARTLLDDANAAAALTTLGISAFAQTILDDTTQAAVRTTLGLTPGTDVQAYDADLAAVAGLASNGLIARTGAGTASVRTITAPAAGITVSNGDGVSGNPTLALANDLSALEALSGTNTIYYRSAADTWTAVTIGSGLSFSAGTLDAASSGGMTLLGTLTTTSGTTQSLTGIAAGYRQLYCEIDGVSWNFGGDALQVLLSSTNGAAYGTARTVSGALSSAGDTIDGAITISNISSTIAAAKTAVCATAVNGVITTSVVVAAPPTNTAAVVNAIRFQPSGGRTFDAGTIRIYGVK